MDGDALIRDYRYAWFVRMSRDQILDSHFVWADLAKKTQHNLFKME
jgi:predicted metal-binding protein